MGPPTTTTPAALYKPDILAAAAPGHSLHVQVDQSVRVASLYLPIYLEAEK